MLPNKTKLALCFGMIFAASIQMACNSPACDKSDATACVAQGEWLSHSSLPESLSKAFQIFDETCDAGNVQACDDLVVMSIEGKSSDNDPKAFETLRKACERGVAGSCADLGVMYGRGEGTQRDLARAIEFFTKACGAGNAAGCTYLGEWYSNAGFRNGWNCGKREFCTMLGDAAAAVPKDDAKALQFYMRACDGGGHTGCASVSQMYRNGAGVRKDEAKADEFWKKSIAAK